MLKKIVIFILIIAVFLGLNSEVLAGQKSLEYRTLQAFDLSQHITYSQMQEILSLPENREFIEARVRQYEFGKNWRKDIPVPEVSAEQIIAGAMIDTATIVPFVGIAKLSIEIAKIRAEATRALVNEYLNSRKQGKSEEQAWQVFLDRRQQVIDMGGDPRLTGRMWGASRFSGIDIREIMRKPDGEYAQAVRLYFAFVWQANELSEQRGDWNKVRSRILSESQRLKKEPLEKTPSVLERVGEWVEDIGNDIGGVIASVGQVVWEGGRSVWNFAQEHNPFRADVVGPEPEPLAPAPAEPETETIETAEEIEIEKVEEVEEVEIVEDIPRITTIAGIVEQLDDLAERIDFLNQRVDGIVKARQELVLAQPELLDPGLEQELIGDEEIKEQEEIEEQEQTKEEIKEELNNEEKQEDEEKEEDEEEKEAKEAEEVIEQTEQKEIVFCDINLAGTSARNRVIFNEIAWMGTQVHHTNEWIELKNISETEINLDGWQIQDKDQQIKIVFSNAHIIPAQGFFLLERTNDDSVPNVLADFIYTGGLRNDNEAIYLFSPDCQLQDKVLAKPNWPAGDSPSRRTMERKTDFSWQTSLNSDGTPKNENSSGFVRIVRRRRRPAPTPEPAPAPDTLLPDILISEVAAGWDKAANEFIELYNPNDFDVILTNDNFKLKLVKSDNDVNVKQIEWFNATIPAKNYFLLVGGEIENINANATFSAQLTSVSGVIITDGDDNIKDRVAWGKICDPQIEDCDRKLPPSEAVEEEGIRLESGLKTGQSLGRRWSTTTESYVYIDTDNNQNDFELQLPTPGKRNQPLPPPQPILDVSPDILNFSAEQDGENPKSQSLTIKNIGEGELNWSISKKYGNPDFADWLSFQPVSGISTMATSSAVKISVDISELLPGNYDAVLTIKKENAQSSYQEIPVSLIIQKPVQPTLSVVINEIAWMGTKAHHSDEWIELYNNTANTIDLDGWVLKAKDGTPKIELSGEILSQGFFLLERTNDNTTSEPADLIYGNDGHAWALHNDGEILELWGKDEQGNLILVDRVGCQKNEDRECKNWFAGENEKDEDNEWLRISMERINPTLPGVDSNNWFNNHHTKNGEDADGNNINGTPKRINSVYQHLPPATITDLKVSGENNTVVLSWTAPDDPNTFQELLVYDIRYFTNQEIAWRNRDRAGRISHSLEVKAPGESQSLTISNLVFNLDYYFVIKTYHRRPSPLGGKTYSALSNNAKYQVPFLSPAPEGKIVFQDWVTGESAKQKFIINADGTGRRDFIADNDAPIPDPRLFLDEIGGKRILNTTSTAGYATRDITVESVDDAGGRSIQNLTLSKMADDFNPVWSPCGTKIAFVSAPRGKNSDIFIMNADGTNIRNVSNTIERDLGPAWSPDGTKIAFSSNIGSGSAFEIFVVDVKDAEGNDINSEAKRLTHIMQNSRFPIWSPCGTKIAFTVISPAEPYVSGVYILVVDTGELVYLVSGEVLDWRSSAAAGQ